MKSKNAVRPKLSASPSTAESYTHPESCMCHDCLPGHDAGRHRFKEGQRVVLAWCPEEHGIIERIEENGVIERTEENWYVVLVDQYQDEYDDGLRLVHENQLSLEVRPSKSKKTAQNYRRLRVGQLIQKTDQCLYADGRWRRVLTSGRKVLPSEKGCFRRKLK